MVLTFTLNPRVHVRARRDTIVLFKALAKVTDILISALISY